MHGYGYCASHTRYFWGLRLHLLCTLGGLPIAFALTGAKAEERETLLDIFATEPTLVTDRPPGQTLIGDNNYFGREFESQLADLNIALLLPARKGEAERVGSQLFKPLRQVIESINETQGPAPPRTASRPNSQWCGCPRAPASTRADRIRPLTA
nr:transposase [Streptomyces sp. 2323.1]